MLRWALLISLAAAARAQGAPSMNPCHGRKEAEAAWGCERVRVPAGLCLACPLRAPADDGTFKDCKQIYDLDAPGCRGRFEEYVALNGCDGRRRELVGTWDAASKERLDYFAYSLCELSCDTIEKGSKIWEYDQRNEQGRLWSLGRGNGPAHFHYDVCAIFPDFKFWALPGENGEVQDHYDWPKVCPLLGAWINSDASKNWIAQTAVDVVPEIRQAVGDGMWALEAHQHTTWQQCLALESKQNRV